MPNKFKAWTEKDDAYLKKHYASTSNVDLTEVLGRSETAKKRAVLSVYASAEVLK